MMTIMVHSKSPGIPKSVEREILFEVRDPLSVVIGHVVLVSVWVTVVLGDQLVLQTLVDFGLNFALHFAFQFFLQVLLQLESGDSVVPCAVGNVGSEAVVLGVADAWAELAGDSVHVADGPAPLAVTLVVVVGVGVVVLAGEVVGVEVLAVVVAFEWTVLVLVELPAIVADVRAVEVLAVQTKVVVVAVDFVVDQVVASLSVVQTLEHVEDFGVEVALADVFFDLVEDPFVGGVVDFSLVSDAEVTKYVSP